MIRDDLKEPRVTNEEAEGTCNLHKYIRSGDIASAASLIENLSMEEKLKLTKPIQELDLKPAIFIAIEARKTKFVKFLVNECGADVNEEAFCTLNKYTLTMQSEMEPGVLSPLEFALFSNMPEIVKFLLSVGADVTKLAKNSSALLTACGGRSIKLAQMLADNGADVNVSTPRGDTCLMISVDSVALCRSLLDNGAKVNSQNDYGETALHIAAQLGRIECMRLLLERGANPFSQNKEGDDVLRVAALNGKIKTSDFLLKTVFKDVKREIESYHLLGSSHIEDHSMPKVLSAWKMAIALASENQIETVATKLETPVGIVVEATTLSDINSMRLNFDNVYMQNMVLVYKHLGPTHSMFQRAIFSCAQRFLDTHSFENCWRMLIYCIRITLSSSLQLSDRRQLLKNISEMTESFMMDLCEMRVKPPIGFAVVYEFMETVTQAAKQCTDPEESDIFIDIALNVIFLQSLIDFRKREKFEFQKLVCAVLKAGRKAEKGISILFGSLQPEKDLEDRIFKLSPYLNVISTLLECGSDISERDENGNNAVHVLVNAFIKNGKSYKYQFRKIANKLVEYGVHLDARNDQRIETTSCLLELGIRVAPPINLMCSSAKAIRRFEFPLQSLERLLPKFLIDFVEMH